jgi:polar amino acid transport system permease protein
MPAQPSFTDCITLTVWGLACLFGTAIGIVIGWLLYRARSARRVVQVAANAIPEIIKGLPVLILLIWCHYLFPYYLGWSISPLFTAVVVFSLIVMVGVGEIVQGAIAGLPSGEIEAGHAIGLDAIDVGRFIALPLAFRAASPALIMLYIDVLKLSTLASVIALDELLHVTDTVIAKTYVAVPAYTALALIFLAMILPMNWAAKKYAESLGVTR